MNETGTISWQGIHAEIMRRISERVWKPGEPVPHEAELASQFGCARATVNRAMQQAADNGFLERRRKAGTRVALHPVRKAKLEIPVTRLEVEGRGQVWRHELLKRRLAVPPRQITEALCLSGAGKILHVRNRHFADEKPFLHEDRWINTGVVPQALDADFSSISANEWLVLNAPFSRGDIVLGASPASDSEAELLGTKAGAALFIVERTTWNHADAVTRVRLAYAPGYRMNSTI